MDPDRRFGTVTLKGKLLDKRTQLQAIIPIRDGDLFDLCKITFLRARLTRLGYHAVITDERLGNKMNVLVKLIPMEHVRHVYIRNNWPLFEDEVLRRVRYRPGSRLPPRSKRDSATFKGTAGKGTTGKGTAGKGTAGKAAAGKAAAGKAVNLTVRQAEFARQKRRIQEFLRKEGYFKSDLTITVERTKRPGVVNLLIKLKKGRLYRLGRLRVQGNRAISTARIRRVFEHRILWWKRSFTTTRFKKDIKALVKLYHSKGYPGVRVRHDFSLRTSLDHKRKRVNINLTIRENKLLDVRFIGRKRISESDLKKALTFFGEGSYDAYEIRQSARAIQHKYQANGFFLASVTPRWERVSPAKLRVDFVIEEGPQLRVQSTLFYGNDKVSDAKLRRVIKTKVFPRLGNIGLGSGGFVTDRQLRQDVKRCANHYRSIGYLDVKVRGSVATRTDAFGRLGVLALDTALHLKKKRGYVHVRFDIVEGPRYVMEHVTMSGHPNRMSKALQKLVKLKPGTHFTRKRFTSDLERLKRFFANQGYPYCLIKGTVLKGREGSAAEKRAYIEIKYEFKLGKRVSFGEIFIRGNFKTSRAIILRELKFKTGDVFSLKKVEAARRNLRSLGIFRATRIEFIGLRSRESPVHVVVKITERFDDYGSLEFGVGLSTDNLYFFSLAYRNRNLFGLGKELEIKGEVGAEIQSGRITYKDPRFFGSRLTFDLTGFIRREDTERLGELLTFGGSVTLLHRVTKELQWFVRYQIKRVRRQEEIYRVAAGADEKDRVDIFTNTISLGPSVIWDKRDNPLVPRKGFKLTGALRVASRYLAYPLPSSNFVHLHFSGQGLLPLPAGIVVALGLRYDHGIPYGGSTMLPKTERFFAGGDTTVRGYEEDRLKTEVIETGVAPFGQPTVHRVKPQGANIRMIMNLELQFPIWKKSIIFGMPILGVLFFDAGALTNALHRMKEDDWKTSIGAALRVVTPVGFVSIEYAIPFQPGPGTDPTGRMHFNFGFIF